MHVPEGEQPQVPAGAYEVVYDEQDLPEIDLPPLPAEGSCVATYDPDTKIPTYFFSDDPQELKEEMFYYLDHLYVAWSKSVETGNMITINDTLSGEMIEVKERISVPITKPFAFFFQTIHWTEEGYMPYTIHSDVLPPQFCELWQNSIDRALSDLTSEDYDKDFGYTHVTATIRLSNDGYMLKLDYSEEIEGEHTTYKFPLSRDQTEILLDILCATPKGIMDRGLFPQKLPLFSYYDWELQE
jgi:hypothetical protein